jgi:hypothetical protein
MERKTGLFGETFKAFERAVQVRFLATSLDRERLIVRTQIAHTAEDKADANFFWGVFLGLQSDLTRAEPEVTFAIRDKAIAKVRTCNTTPLSATMKTN